VDLDAPEGRYKVDAFTSILQANGWPEKYSQPHKIIREVVNNAGSSAFGWARSGLELPRRIKNVKLFFENLRKLKRLTDLLCRVDPEDFAVVAYKIDLPEETEPAEASEAVFRGTESLIEILQKCNADIEYYLNFHGIGKFRGGNVDELGSWFIREMACGRRRLGYVLPLQATDIKLFSNLLDAGWTDLKFPLENHLGKSMEPLDMFFEERVKWMLRANRL
jgi:hypothetical protein